jgi:DNA-binding LacI/PurR family transcriptional regulator
VAANGRGSAPAPKPEGGGERRATIVSVAERAGVSKSLVSLVMRGSPKVSEARREAVLEAARELGYRPNLIARGLAEKRTRTLGVLVSDLHNPFFAEVVDGLQERARDDGFRILIGSGRQDAEEEREALESFLEQRVDGVVLLSPVVKRNVLTSAAEEVPTVVVARHGRPISHADSVVTDEQVGTRLAVEHLTELGHTRIAHIDGGEGASAAERRRGYEEAMEEAGLGDRVRIEPGTYTGDGGYEGMLALLGDERPPTAVLAANDLAAVGALTALEERGLKVGEDVSLVGYDDSYLARIPHISLTSVAQPRLELGQLAFDAFERRFDAPGRRATKRVVEPRLVVRGSTGPPPGRD